jgi:DNA-directed RNA polymerase beta' subunit
MINFYERFDEILDYYATLNPKKEEYVKEIRDNRDLVFCHSIPVFTTHLRPADIKDGYMYFEPTNAMYNMINTHVHKINKNSRKMDRDPKLKSQELWEVQKKYMELVEEIMNILTGKKGTLRSLVGGRYNFSCRSVIRQDATLRVDQVKLPYVELVKCLQQPIINILVRNYNISPSEAYDWWYKSITKKDERIAQILDNLIHANPEGLPVLINRNPTINYGSILQMFVVGYTDTLTMSVPLQVLKSLAADFDGDVLNILHIINRAFFERCNIVFNPRNAMYISRIDGKLNSDLIVQRDTLINANTFLHLGRKNYTEEQLKAIKETKERQKEYYISSYVS